MREKVSQSFDELTFSTSPLEETPGGLGCDNRRVKPSQGHLHRLIVFVLLKFCYSKFTTAQFKMRW